MAQYLIILEPPLGGWGVQLWRVFLYRTGHGVLLAFKPMESGAKALADRDLLYIVDLHC